MTKLKDDDLKSIKSMFDSDLKNKVKMMFFYDGDSKVCPYCSDELELLSEIAELSPNLELEKYEVNDKNNSDIIKKLNINVTPSLLFEGKEIYNLRFLGIPAGYEFASLLEDIVDVSNGTTGLPNDIKENLKKINNPVNIKVFVTPTCPWCPKAVRLAHQFAIENDNITGVMIEAAEFGELSSKYSVMAVPKIVINDRSYFEGAQPAQVFLEYINEELENNSKN